MNETVLIVDDHPGFRSWTRSLLETAGFTVVGEAGDGSSALVAARQLRPDVVLLDVVLPDITGFVVAERLSALPVPPVVVLVSSREASDFGDVLGHSQARAFITKGDLSGSRLCAAIGAST